MTLFHVRHDLRKYATTGSYISSRQNRPTLYYYLILICDQDKASGLLLSVNPPYAQKSVLSHIASKDIEHVKESFPPWMIGSKENVNSWCRHGGLIGANDNQRIELKLAYPWIFDVQTD